MSPKSIEEYPRLATGGGEPARQPPSASSVGVILDATAAAHGDLAHKSAPGLRSAGQFLSEYWLRILGISALVLTPCFWQRRIQAGDLSSHVYNAWLAQLIAQGQAPGLWIARQWHNVLFDFLLLHLGNIVGLPAAQRISVSAAVLIFFWGAFALICTMSRQAPWRILPGVAIFSYGWTFQMGFFNYYISLGLAFFALALLYRGRGWQRALAFVLVPLIWMAHPLGLALLIGMGVYLVAAEYLRPRQQFYCAAAAVLLLLGLRLYLVGHYAVLFSASKYMFNGADQLITYGERYRILAYAFLAFLALCLLLDAVLRRQAYKNEAEQEPKQNSSRGQSGQDLPPSFALSVQLYGLLLLAAFLLPSAVYMPRMAAAPISFLTERLTSVSAIMLCCLVGTTKPQKWHLAGLAVFAAIFFIFTYQDTATINRMEDQVRLYERALPPGQRIIATIWPLQGSRVYINPMVDRACIGQCFSYGNYEASSLQFQIRAQASNPFVVSDYANSDAIQSGAYIIQPQDLPLYQIYQCDPSRTKLCMRELAVGETNGRLGFHMAR